MLHFVPSKCSMSGVRLPRLSTEAPTAKMLLAEIAFSEFRDSPFAKCALETTLQVLPLKCWTRENLLFVCSPTAQTLVLARTATLFTRPALAMGTFAQPVPLKCNETELVADVAQISVSLSAESELTLPMPGVNTKLKITGAVVEAMLRFERSCAGAASV